MFFQLPAPVLIAFLATPFCIAACSSPGGGPDTSEDMMSEDGATTGTSGEGTTTGTTTGDGTSTGTTSGEGTTTGGATTGTTTSGGTTTGMTSGEGTTTGGTTTGTTTSGGTTTGTSGGSDVCVPNEAGSTIDQGDGTFLDERTCLMWLSDPLDGAVSGGLTGIEHVNTCPSVEVGGYGDWRGPDVGELETLVTGCTWNDQGNWVPEVNVSGFNYPDFWTVTDGNDSTHTCMIRGQNGSIEGGRRADTNVHVLCVRGTSPVTGTVTTCGGTGCD